jgi:hypothetical protein
MNHAFEQQPRESAKAFAAFSLYLNLGPQRSTAAVANKLAKSEQLIRRWSAKFAWTDRVAAHAAHYAIIEREAVEAVARNGSNAKRSCASKNGLCGANWSRRD